MTDLESGKVPNETKTTYSSKDEDGKMVTEEVTKNKDTGEVTRKVDGEEIKKEEPPQPQILKYLHGNADYYQGMILKMILEQLREMNYYLMLAVKDKINKEDAEEAINGRPKPER